MNSITLAIINDQESYREGVALCRTYMEFPNITTSFFIEEIRHLCSQYYKYSKDCYADRQQKRSEEYIDEAAAQAAEYWLNHYVENYYVV